MANHPHTPESLVQAIKSLFELNHYSVETSVEVHGAEVDLVARPLNDPFGATVYIEATIEHVTVVKYGKDLTKLAMLGLKDPGSQRLIVSSISFTAGVRERALQTGIRTLTIGELYRQFERFSPYTTAMLGDTPEGRELANLDHVYEEPIFKDEHGEERATVFLNSWCADVKRRDKWLVITGEYGTGKTALTRVLQKRWLKQHVDNPAAPLPFRIELRDFTRQFDARGLLHHFLDKNRLGHLSVDFVFSLVRSGRIILLLDGYDEMAQYLHARERRACLEALADLSSEGARGLLTSRPNYFTETEEFQVFEVLYSSLRNGNYFLTRETERLLEEEKRVDHLLESFMERHERRLRDLSPAQTEALLGRLLADDTEGRDVVLGILTRVFRSSEGGDALSLSGKPVIIAYLVEVVEQLKAHANPEPTGSRLTEWQVYKLIVDQLMVRDFARAPELSPELRRRFLQRLARRLSERDHAVASEDDLKDLIATECKRDLDRLPSDSRAQQLERLFADLRASATLTRAEHRGRDGWRFSHNSLREYLVAESLTHDLLTEEEVVGFEAVPISDAMRTFVTSRPADERRKLGSRLARRWSEPSFVRARSAALQLVWDGVLALQRTAGDPCRAAIVDATGAGLDLQGVSLSRMNLSTDQTPSDLSGANFDGCALTEVGLMAANLRGANFRTASLQSVSFVSADLSGAAFKDALIIDCNITGATVADTDFSGVKPENVSVVTESIRGELGHVRYEGYQALGLLEFLGALTPGLPPIHRLRHHRNFGIADKIMELMSKQTRRQRRGLEQRGEAQSDVTFARSFMQHLEKQRYLVSATKDTVDATERGREVFMRYARSGELPEDIIAFFDNSPGAGRGRVAQQAAPAGGASHRS